MENEVLSQQSVLVRDWDSRNFREMSNEDWIKAEDKAGKNSAFAETRSVLSNGKVAGTNWTVTEFFNYRNS